MFYLTDRPKTREHRGLAPQQFAARLFRSPPSDACTMALVYLSFWALPVQLASRAVPALSIFLRRLFQLVLSTDSGGSAIVVIPCNGQLRLRHAVTELFVAKLLVVVQPHMERNLRIDCSDITIMIIIDPVDPRTALHSWNCRHCCRHSEQSDRIIN